MIPGIVAGQRSLAQIIKGLFAAGQQGFWFPFTDFASLSQDSAGTLPYTALAQPVGRVLDRSGRGNHATQPTSTARPKITQAVGQPKFLTFDGVDDRLQVTLPAITGTWIVGYKEGTLVYKVNIPAGAFPIGTNSFSNLWSPSKNFVGMVLRSGALTEVEVSAVERYLVANGAGAAGVDAFAGVTNFQAAWRGCSSLTSFPLINTSAGTNFQYTWYGCSSITSFPLINTSAGISFNQTWYGCSSLTSFPLINTSAGTNFAYTWYGCASLTSFPLINTSAGISFQSAWAGCSSLTSFPSAMFDSCPAVNFAGTFQNCALSQASVDGILASLVTAGRTNGTVNVHGGTSATPSAAGLASKATLVSRGWTVTHN